MENIRTRQRIIRSIITIINWINFISNLITLSHNRRWWERPDIGLRNRLVHGVHTNLFYYFKFNNHEQFFNFTRMTVPQFTYIHQLVEPALTSRSFRPGLPSELKLAAVLNVLAHGVPVAQQSWVFRIGLSTLYELVPKVCEAIYQSLSRNYVRFPGAVEDWLEISNQFNHIWNFPHCLGALDGKLFFIRKPPNSGSQYFSYKQRFAVIMLAICDAAKRFIWFNVGDYGSMNDSGYWQTTDLYNLLELNAADFLPPPSPLPGTNVMCPFFLVADPAFALKPYLMTPYARVQNLSFYQRIYNYRQSRARLIIECAFGLLASKWQIFQIPIRLKVETLERIVKAAIALHNFLITTEIDQDIQHRLYDNRNEVIDEGEQEQQVPQDQIHFIANQVREMLSQYFLTPQGWVPWQVERAFA